MINYFSQNGFSPVYSKKVAGIANSNEKTPQTSEFFPLLAGSKIGNTAGNTDKVLQSAMSPMFIKVKNTNDDGDCYVNINEISSIKQIDDDSWAGTIKSQNNYDKKELLFDNKSANHIINTCI